MSIQEDFIRSGRCFSLKASEVMLMRVKKSFFSLDPSYRMDRVYKWNWTMCVCMCACMYVRHHFEDYHYFCSQASQTPITIHIPKAYDESYSKIIGGHKYKDKDNDKDKVTDKVAEKPNIYYIFEILMTYSSQI